MAARPLYELQTRCRPLRIHALVAMEAARCAGDHPTEDYWADLLRPAATPEEQAEADDVCRGVLALALEWGADYPRLLADTAAVASQLNLAAVNSHHLSGD